MAETPADVRRDIEMTRERISDTLQQLEQKANVTQIIKDHPWPAIGLAVGAGFLLSGSSVDVKAAASTVAATKGASSKVGTLLDDMVANLMGGVHTAFQSRIDSFVNELKVAIGAPTTPGAGSGANGGSGNGQPGSASGMQGRTVSSAGSGGFSADAAQGPRAD